MGFLIVFTYRTVEAFSRWIWQSNSRINKCSFEFSWWISGGGNGRLENFIPNRMFQFTTVISGNYTAKTRTKLG